MFLWRSCILTLLISAILLPAAAQSKSYKAFDSDVPFPFHVGEHKFRPGHYQFVVVGAGLMVMRDSRAHVLSRLITRQVPGQDHEGPSQLWFEKNKGDRKLRGIWDGPGTYEIMGEEVPVYQAQPDVKLPFGIPPSQGLLPKATK